MINWQCINLHLKNKASAKKHDYVASRILYGKYRITLLEKNVLITP